MHLADIEIPNWCDYPNANEFIWGCWSLTRGMVTGEPYCKECTEYKPRRSMEELVQELISKLSDTRMSIDNINQAIINAAKDNNSPYHDGFLMGLLVLHKSHCETLMKQLHDVKESIARSFIS
jgi:hypothetical protein